MNNIMRIDDFTERRIKDAADIVDVVGAFVELHKRGARLEGLCPFHGDKHCGSFVVLPNQNIYYCWSCGAKGDSIEFLKNYGGGMTYTDALLWLANRYGIDTSSTGATYRPLPPVKRVEPVALPMLTIPRELVAQTMKATANDTLCNWLRSLPWNEAQRNRIEHTLWEYCVGHTDGYAIFWEVDTKGLVHTAKMMKYREDGHRDRLADWNFTFAHKYFAGGASPVINTEGKEVKVIGFGFHLLNRYPKAQVNVVESEKTAILAAIYYGNFEKNIWLASGGMSMITRERFADIFAQHRRVVFYPDKDGIDKWREQAKTLNYDKGVVSTHILDTFATEADGDKCDIGDIIVRCLQHPDTIKAIPTPRKALAAEGLERLKASNPAANELITKLNLTAV